MSFASSDESESPGPGPGPGPGDPYWYVRDAEWWTPTYHQGRQAAQERPNSGRRPKRKHSRVPRDDQTTPNGQHSRDGSSLETALLPQAAVAANTISDGRPKRNRSGCVFDRSTNVHAINVQPQAEDEKCEAARNHHRSGGCRAPHVLKELCGGAVRRVLCGKCGRAWWSRAPLKDAACPGCQRGTWSRNCKLVDATRVPEQPLRAGCAKQAAVAAAAHHHQTSELQAKDEECEAARNHHHSGACCAAQELEDVWGGAVCRCVCGKCGKDWWSRAPLKDAMCPGCHRGFWCWNCKLALYARRVCEQRLQAQFLLNHGRC